MNRLSPLIARQIRHPGKPVAQWGEPGSEPKPARMDDLQLFLTGWLGGLVFFGTFLF